MAGDQKPLTRPAGQAEGALEQLQSARRQAAVGRLAGALAHDFNNLLTAILGYSEMLLDEADADHPWRTDLEEIRSAGHRAAHLTRQLLAFNRHGHPMLQLMSWAALVDELEPLLRALLGEPIRFTVSSGPGAWADVLFDKGDASSVLFSLALLSHDCLGDEGSCDLSIDRVTSGSSDAGRVVLHWACRAPTGAEAPTYAGSPFDEIRSLVESTGATFTVERATDAGWGVTLSYDVAETAMAVVETEPIPEPAELTALLVEDEDLLRQVVRKMLERHGFRVIEAASGFDALDGRADRGEAVDVLVTDVVMPSMSGLELAQRMLERRPDLPVLFMSGYTDAATIDLRGPARGFIPKPFTRDQLVKAIQDLLSRARATRR